MMAVLRGRLPDRVKRAHRDRGILGISTSVNSEHGQATGEYWMRSPSTRPTPIQPLRDMLRRRDLWFARNGVNDVKEQRAVLARRLLVFVQQPGNVSRRLYRLR